MASSLVNKLPQGTRKFGDDHVSYFYQGKDVSPNAFCLKEVNVDRWIQKFEADGDQRDGEAALQGGGRGIRGYVGLLCGERSSVGEGRAAP